MCRTGYTGFPACGCETENGFREELYSPQGDPKTCLACTAGPGCHKCAADLNTCSGCRANFLFESNGCLCPMQAGAGLVITLSSSEATCSCTAEGYRVNSTVVPNTCERCLVNHCNSCIADKAVCDVGGCRSGFTRNPSGSACDCAGSGFGLNLSVTPNTCESCTVLNCALCSNDVSLCEMNGCRANYVRSANGSTCTCPSVNFFELTSTIPQQCNACSSSCETCQGPSYDQCLTCPMGGTPSNSPVGTCQVPMSFAIEHINRG